MAEYWWGEVYHTYTWRHDGTTRACSAIAHQIGVTGGSMHRTSSFAPTSVANVLIVASLTSRSKCSTPARAGHARRSFKAAPVAHGYS